MLDSGSVAEVSNVPLVKLRWHTIDGGRLGQSCASCIGRKPVALRPPSQCVFDCHPLLDCSCHRCGPSHVLFGTEYAYPLPRQSRSTPYGAKSSAWRSAYLLRSRPLSMDPSISTTLRPTPRTYLRAIPLRCSRMPTRTTPGTSSAQVGTHPRRSKAELTRAWFVEVLDALEPMPDETACFASSIAMSRPRRQKWGASRDGRVQL